MRRLTLAVMISLLAASTAAAADKWWDFYKRATVAIQKSDWSVVADQMSRSIALQPNEELAAKARNEILVYVPHFWLGIAKFNLGDVDGAIREWDISQSQGVVQRTQYYPDLRTYLSRAQAQKVKNTAALSADSRKAADAALQQALTGQVQAISAGADRSESYRLANSRLKEAWDQFNKAGNDTKAYARAAETASSAKELFQAAAQEGASRKAARALERPRQLPRPPVATVTPPPVVVTPPPVQTAIVPPPETVVTATAQKEANPDAVRVSVLVDRFGQRLVDSESAGKSDSSLRQFLRGQAARIKRWESTLEKPKVTSREARQIERDVAGADRELSQRLIRLASSDIPLAPSSARPYVPTAAVKAELKKAYLAFASGKLDEAEGILNGIVGKEPRSDEAFLLRGCARYTRVMLSGSAQPSLSAVSSDFQAALQRNASLKLDPIYFSPKLVVLFEEMQRAVTR